MAEEPLTELQLDGLIGPTHNYAGLSFGNVASYSHRNHVSQPRAAALQGLAKMRAIYRMGVPQGVLPPHDRPSFTRLRQWGFAGKDEEVLAKAALAHEGWLLRLASSASAMWAANAATVAPSTDTLDGRVHFVVANLASHAHRSLEPPLTERILRTLFSHRGRFAVHGAPPGGNALADEGAANHTRLQTETATVHLFAWGCSHQPLPDAPARFPARQTLEGSVAVARLLRVPEAHTYFVRQLPRGIDAGAFHTDVLAVGNGPTMLMHEAAFADVDAVGRELAQRLGEQVRVRIVREHELPVTTAVACYPFNSQLLVANDGRRILVAPKECEENEACQAWLAGLVAAGDVVQAVTYVDVRQSMRNGGGPACLRLRVPLTEHELGAIEGRVLVNDGLLDELETWVKKHYRESLAPADLADPQLARESMEALDELTQILHLGSLYDFQRVR